MSLDESVLMHYYSIRVDVVSIVSQQSVLFSQQIHQVSEICYLQIKLLKFLIICLHLLRLLEFLLKLVQLLVKCSGFLVRVLQAALLKFVDAVLLPVFGEFISVDLQLLRELFNSQLEVFHSFLDQDCLIA